MEQTATGALTSCGQCHGLGGLPSPSAIQHLESSPLGKGCLVVIYIIGAAIGLAIALGALYGFVWILHAMWRTT